MLATDLGNKTENVGAKGLLVDSESAEYWTSPGGTAATVLQWVKSKVTHSRMSVGESGTVEL